MSYMHVHIYAIEPTGACTCAISPRMFISTGQTDSVQRPHGHNNHVQVLTAVADLTRSEEKRPPVPAGVRPEIEV
jgi:hypothetical protein